MPIPKMKLYNHTIAINKHFNPLLPETKKIYIVLQKFPFKKIRVHKKVSYDLRVYKSVDDKSLP